MSARAVTQGRSLGGHPRPFTGRLRGPSPFGMEIQIDTQVVHLVAFGFSYSSWDCS